MQRVLHARRAALLAVAAAAAASTAALAADPAMPSPGIMQFEHVRVVDAPVHDASPGPSSSAVLRAYIDPATGRLRQPTPEELAAQALPAATSRSRAAAAEPRFIDVQGGGVGVVLDESTMQFAVVSRAADGTLVEACEPGEEAAHAAATKAAAFRTSSGGNVR